MCMAFLRANSSEYRPMGSLRPTDSVPSLEARQVEKASVIDFFSRWNAGLSIRRLRFGSRRPRLTMPKRLGGLLDLAPVL
jgi:hypothetical protein